MKKLILGFLSLLLIVVSVQAQDLKSELKDAQKAFNRFNLDQANNKGDLKEAKAAIDRALATGEGQSSAKAWNTKGDIYNEIANQIIAIRQLGLGDESELPQVDNPALEAYQAYEKGLELAEKKFETKDALKGLQNVQPMLSNLGVYMYEEQKYDEAYSSFNGVIGAHETLKASGEDSSLDDPAEMNNQMYITGLAALNANKTAEAKPYFMQLYEQEYDKPLVYEAMYKIASDEESPEAAYRFLETGREKYPDDVSLLFADINHALKTNQLDLLITKLESAIEKEPNNVTLYTTTGNVYDQLYQKARQDNDQAKADEYFDKAKSYYEKGREIDPKNFDAIYSLGTLYYNRAAGMTQELNKLADDYSQEGIKKYEALKEEMFDQFNKALPYFKECEMLNPNDVNTLIALKEIYAREDKLEISNAFKERLETVQGGGTLDNSYFKSNQK